MEYLAKKKSFKMYFRKTLSDLIMDFLASNAYHQFQNYQTGIFFPKYTTVTVFNIFILKTVTSNQSYYHLSLNDWSLFY